MKNTKKIFQIGFNKCGTGSLHKFLLKNNINSVHFKRGEIARTIFKNYNSGEPLLTGLDDYQAFTDMEWVTHECELSVGTDLYKELYQEYPDAVFILNTRNIDKWLKSRISHNGGSYLSRYRSILDLPKDNIIEHWRERYLKHISDVELFFSDNKDANFIHWKIDDCENHQLADFLIQAGFDIRNKIVPHSHKSKCIIDNSDQIILDYILDLGCLMQSTNKKFAIRLFQEALAIEPENNYAIKKLLALSKMSALKSLLKYTKPKLKRKLNLSKF